MNKITTPYHHGDLRNTAIIAAAELIDQTGNYEISIANVAKRAGVSSAALYRHFEDKEALLTAVRELALIGLCSDSRWLPHSISKALNFNRRARHLLFAVRQRQTLVLWSPLGRPRQYGAASPRGPS